MSLDHMQVRRARIAVESAFGVDMTSDVATNFKDLRILPGVMTRDTQMADDETVVQRFFQRRNKVLGPRRASFPLQAYWTSTNEPLVTAATPTKTAQSIFFEQVMGGYIAAAGSTVAASPSPTTTGCTVGAGHGSRFSEGQIAAIEVSGVHYPVYITGVSTDALTWWPALPAAPSSGDDVLNAQCNFFDEDDDASLQLLAEAAKDRGNIWLLRGAQGDLKFDLGRGGLLSWTSQLMGASYDHDDEIATPQGGSAIAVASYVDSSPKWGATGGIHFGPTGSTTRSLVRVEEIAVDLGISWTEIGDHAGLEGIGDWERNRNPMMVELTITKSASDGTFEAYHDAFEAETDYGMLAWWGATGGDIRAICAPTMQIAKAPESVDVNGFERIKVTCMVKESSLASDQSTALRRSPVVLAAA
ncbi:MAG: hypothetical protein AB7T06_29290 [Kofleriaceae bacterium]